jgi:hypothetical protein
MREIQDLTLQIERGMAVVMSRFEERQEEFSIIWKNFIESAPIAFGIRATLVPLVPLNVERVHNNDSVRPPAIALWTVENEREPLKFPTPITGGTWRPLIRGTTWVEAYGMYDYRRTVFSDGRIEYLMLNRQEGSERLFVSPSEVVWIAASSLLAAERFRSAAGAPDVEYGLEIEIRVRGDQVPVSGYGTGRPMRPFGTFEGQRTIFPRYSVGPREEFAKVWSLFVEDFWNAAGADMAQGEISLDFQRAFRQLGITSD